MDPVEEEHQARRAEELAQQYIVPTLLQNVPPAPVWNRGVTNFIRSYLHQIFDDSHGLNASLKPLRRPFDRCQSRLEAINIGRDIKQINW